MNIYQKILEIMKKVDVIVKDGIVQIGDEKYNVVTEELVTSTIRPYLIEYGVVIIPIEQECENKVIAKTEKSTYSLTTTHTKYRIQNVDDLNDYIIAESNGMGADTQDKGVGMAMTYSYKYLLLRTFAIPTKEDTDKQSSKVLDNKINNERKAEEKRKINEERIKKRKLEKQKIEEVKNKPISLNKQDSLKKAIENNNISDEEVEKILKKYGCKEIKDIKNRMYQNIIKDFRMIKVNK